MEIQSEGKATNRREMGLISEVDRKTIKDMRNAGVGYLVIGNTLGYSRDAVRNYCRRAGLDGKLGCIPSNSEDKVVHNIHVMNPTLQYIDGYAGRKSKVTVRCTVCGHTMQRVYLHLTQKQVPCEQCKAAVMEQRKEHRLAQHRAQVQARTEKRAKRAADKQKEYEANHTFVCEVCGKEYYRITQGKRKYCSKECARKAQREQAKANGYNKDKRIPKEKLIDKDITLESLYKRDSGVCYLCGGKCNLDDYIAKSGTIICGDWYPSIDHVVPVAHGGEHSWKNVKLAHRRCNYLKSDKAP